MHLRYNLYGASIAGDNRHAQVAMKELGITYQHATPQSISDEWWFWNCKDVPATLPKYIEELKLDPMKCIGYGLSQETAEKIRDAAG
jgi:hypothetical protein